MEDKYIGNYYEKYQKYKQRYFDLTGRISSYREEIKQKMTDLQMLYEFELVNENPDLMCPIGLNIMIFPTKTNCGHVFEKKHILSWFKGHPNCHLCRTEIEINGLVDADDIIAELQNAKIKLVIENPTLVDIIKFISKNEDGTYLIEYDTYKKLMLSFYEQPE